MIDELIPNFDHVKGIALWLYLCVVIGGQRVVLSYVVIVSIDGKTSQKPSSF